MFRPPGVESVPVQYLELPSPSGSRIAYRRYEASPPAKLGLVYLAGLRGDMQGPPSTCMEVESQLRLHTNCVSFDFQGQGLSGGDPDAVSLQQVGDALAVLDHVCSREPQVLVGCSTGAWVALHAALQRPGRVKSLILVSPAVDVTSHWLRGLAPEQRAAAERTRRVPLPDGVGHAGDSLPLAFFEAAQAGLLLRGAGSVAFDCPVRIFHGMRDAVAPARLSRELLDALRSGDVHVTLIKDGGHKLGRPQDISAIMAAVQEMVEY